MRILLAMSNIKLTEELTRSLKGYNYITDIADEREEALDQILSAIYDVAVVDNKLCKIDDIIELREECNNTPILYMCGGDDVSERIAALDGGADDSLPKQYIYDELLARIRALTRRQVVIQPMSLNFADLSLELSDMTLSCAYRKVKLSYKEFELMRILMLNSHGIVRKESLLVKIWGSDSEAVYNNVEAYVSLLRKKLHQIGSGVYISAIRSVGYQLEFRQPT